jgi:hypothetical protein
MMMSSINIKQGDVLEVEPFDAPRISPSIAPPLERDVCPLGASAKPVNTRQTHVKLGITSMKRGCCINNLKVDTIEVQMTERKRVVEGYRIERNEIEMEFYKIACGIHQFRYLNKKNV